MDWCLCMCHASTGTAVGAGAQAAPSLFAVAVCEPGHGDVRILDELCGGRRREAGGRRARMALVMIAVLAIVLAPSFVIWERWRATAGVTEGGGEGLDVVAMSVPIAAGVRQEPVPAAQELVPPLREARAPAATIVEMPSSEGERPETAIRRPGVASARPAGVRSARVARVTDTRASRGATVPHAAARSQGTRGGDSAANARHPLPQVRRPSAVPKDVDERIDSDVQVIEAIVTRSR